MRLFDVPHVMGLRKALLAECMRLYTKFPDVAEETRFVNSRTS